MGDGTVGRDRDPIGPLANGPFKIHDSFSYRVDVRGHGPCPSEHITVSKTNM